eukprot:scaffold629673_cov50-Prasinocladus_malaysianus.AAC.1
MIATTSCAFRASVTSCSAPRAHFRKLSMPTAPVARPFLAGEALSVAPAAPRRGGQTQSRQVVRM